MLVCVDLARNVIVQVCANCNQENTIDIAPLRVGRVSVRGTNPNIIALPTCKCGATEYLHRTWDALPKQFHPRQRELVNGLGCYLKEVGQITAGCADLMKLEEEPAQWQPMVAGRIYR